MALGFISISLKECLVALYMPDKEGYIENIETYHRHGLRESHNNRIEELDTNTCSGLRYRNDRYKCMACWRSHSILNTGSSFQLMIMWPGYTCR